MLLGPSGETCKETTAAAGDKTPGETIGKWQDKICKETSEGTHGRSSDQNADQLSEEKHIMKRPHNPNMTVR